MVDNFNIHEWNQKRYLAEQQSQTFNLSKLTFDQIAEIFPKDMEFGGVSFPLGGDTLLKIRDESDLEAWKSKTMKKYGDVEIKLDPNAVWFNKVQILDTKFTQDQNQAIQSKADTLDRWGGSKD